MKIELPESSYKEIVLHLLRLRKRYRVRGASMFPTLKAGDMVLYNPRAYKRNLPNAGDIVIAIHPARSDLKIVKRVGNVKADGRVFIVGDNPGETTDSHDFGHVPIDEILGQVTSRLP